MMIVDIMKDGKIMVHEEIIPISDCQNEASFGEVCVRCNKCHRWKEGEMPPFYREATDEEKSYLLTKVNDSKFEKPKITWEYGMTELWQHDLFDNIEDCFEDATDCGLNKGECIAVGEAIPYQLYVSADDVLERLEEEAYGDCGECAEIWAPSRIEQKEIDKLSDKLTQCVCEWLEEHHEIPTFYKIENVREVMIE